MDHRGQGIAKTFQKGVRIIGLGTFQQGFKSGRPDILTRIEQESAKARPKPRQRLLEVEHVALREQLAQFSILGPLDISRRGTSLVLHGPRQRRLLAALLLRPNRTVPADELVDAVWGEDPPATARSALQVHVSQLRKLFGPESIETHPGGYLLRLEPEQLDAARFERLLGEARAADLPGQASALLREALALVRGPALADLAGESFARPEAARLDELRLAALEERIDADLATGGGSELIGELEALVTAHPLREHLRVQLMRALYRGGRQADALAAYRSARETLVGGLGVEPG